MQKLLIILLILSFIGVSIWWAHTSYIKFTIPVPTHGGQYIEAITKQPRFINPLLSHSSSITDKTISKLVFSSLFSYNKDGILQKDLVDKYEIEDNGKKYVIHLKKNVFWHDGEKFDAQDVIYTVNIAKNPDYGSVGVSSDIRFAWKDINVEKQDDYTIIFSFEKPKADFLHTLTLGILPEHIWSNIPIEQFNISQYNVKPIGLGPYEFVDVVADSENIVQEYILRAYDKYHKGEPYITKFSFKFFANRDLALSAYKSGQIGGITLDLKEQLETVSKDKKSFIELPSFYGIFMNKNKSVPLAYKEVRQALALATDRNEIISAVFGEMAQPVTSTLLQGMNGYDNKFSQSKFDINKAKDVLEKSGWKVGDGGIRGKSDEEILSFTLIVREGQKQLIDVANILQKQWHEIGVDMKIKKVSKEDMSVNIIKPRKYEAILFSQPLRWDNPHMGSLWHSDSAEDPGRNFAQLKDDKIDKAIASLDVELNPDKRIEAYKIIQDRIKEENPVIFLFAPGFFFVHSSSLKGFDVDRVNVSYDRFSDVNKWYVSEKRVRKNKDK